MSKKILIINTGGTLSSVKGTNGLIPGMSSNDMLEELRMVSKNLELETEDFCSLDSANIGPADWAGLAKLISQKSYDYHGINPRNRYYGIYFIHVIIYASEHFHTCGYHRQPAFYR